MMNDVFSPAVHQPKAKNQAQGQVIIKLFFSFFFFLKKKKKIN